MDSFPSLQELSHHLPVNTPSSLVLRLKIILKKITSIHFIRLNEDNPTRLFHIYHKSSPVSFEFFNLISPVQVMARDHRDPNRGLQKLCRRLYQTRRGQVPAFSQSTRILPTPHRHFSIWCTLERLPRKLSGVECRQRCITRVFITTSFIKIFTKTTS